MTELALINNTQLWLEYRGQGEAIVFIHGFSLDARMWDEQFATFSESYRVIRYDTRGFGHSAVPSEPYRHIDDLRAILDYLHIEKANLIGLSMGGGIALDFSLEYPERVRSLVLVDSILSGYKMSAEWEAGIAPIWEKGRSGDKEGARQIWLQHALFAPVLASAANNAFEQIVLDYSGWHWLHKNPHQALKPPALERLEQVTVPTLIALGEKDLPDFHTITDTLLGRIPISSKKVLADVGHMANMEAPEPFNALVHNFLNSFD